MIADLYYLNSSDISSDANDSPVTADYICIVVSVYINGGKTECKHKLCYLQVTLKWQTKHPKFMYRGTGVRGGRRKMKEGGSDCYHQFVGKVIKPLLIA